MKSLPQFKNKSSLEDIVWVIALIVILRFIVLNGIGIILNLPSHTGSDQELYMAAGQEYTRSGLALERAPVYSIWMGLIYFLSGHDMIALMYNEKIASIVLISLLMLILGWKYFDKWTALFFFSWIWNCKYLLTEGNGSHALATAFLIGALILLSFKNRSTRSLSVLMLFLSALCRSEMWVVMFIFSVTSFIYYFLKAKKSNALKEYFQPKLFSGLILTCSVCIVLFFYVKSHRANPEPERFSVAFCQNFSVNYVERNNLQAEYPHPWNTFSEIWNKALPGASTPADALKLYPKEIMGHIAYNLKLSAVGIPAAVFGLLSRSRFVIAFLGWMLILSFFRRKNFNVRFDPFINFLLLSTFILIPISLIMKAAMRYYEQLVPVLMIITALLFIRIAGKLRERFMKNRILTNAPAK